MPEIYRLRMDRSEGHSSDGQYSYNDAYDCWIFCSERVFLLMKIFV